jgi:ankyrin repeat protein
MSKAPSGTGSYTFLNLAGATPFLLAALAVDVPAMKMLVANGANPLIPTNSNTTPLMTAAGIGYEEGAHTAWSETAALDAVKLVVKLGGDVRGVDAGGNTALHGAALTGANSVVKFLVENGANLSATNKQGWMPVDVADGIRIGTDYKFRPKTAALLRQLMAAQTAR